MGQPAVLKTFLLFLFVNLVVHLPYMQMPPCGAHVWRQCNTLAMSRNFAEGNMNILEPRIDRSNETDGLTGSPFPLYEWLLALVSKVFGFSDTLARVYSLIISSLGLLAFYLILIQLKVHRFTAACGALLLLSVPQLYYDSINAMPDLMAMALSLFALYAFMRFFEDQKLIWLIPAILCSAAGGLIKFQFLIIPFSSIAFLRLNKRQIIASVVSIIIVILPVIAWYQYALYLTRLNNLKEFGLWIQPISATRKLQTLYGNLVSDVPELLIGWPLLGALIVLLIRQFRSIKFSSPNTRMLLLWTVSFAVFYIVAIERMMHHSYYFMAILPAIIIVFIKLTIQQKWSKSFLLILLILNFTWSFARIIPSRWTSNKMDIPAEFADKTLRHQLENSIPANTKCVIGSDVSGCIFFYFTHTKGYSIIRAEELLEVKQEGVYIDVMKRNGVKFLIFNKAEELKPFLGKIGPVRLKTTIGSFQVWELL